MRFIATKEAINKLNAYKMTEMEVAQEHKALWNIEHERGNIGQAIINFKNKDLIIAPVGKRTALIYKYKQEIKGDYRALPEIEFNGKEWKIK